MSQRELLSRLLVFSDVLPEIVVEAALALAALLHGVFHQRGLQAGERHGGGEGR